MRLIHIPKNGGTSIYNALDMEEPGHGGIKKYDKNLNTILSQIKQIENLQFFIDNKSDNRVTEIESGLQYLVLEEGNPEGISPNADQIISAHFHGTLTNGEVFWSSLDSEPLTIELSKLIIGCQKIISLMKVGAKWKAFIDPTMAYGEEGRPGIPSNSILIFDIELIAVN